MEGCVPWRLTRRISGWEVVGITLAVFTFVMGIVAVFVLSLVIDFLAPTFGGQKDNAQALKLAAYSYTPAWVAGVLQILPLLGVLGLLAGLYGIYLLYLGLPTLGQLARPAVLSTH